MRELMIEQSKRDLEHCFERMFEMLKRQIEYLPSSEGRKQALASLDASRAHAFQLVRNEKTGSEIDG